MKKIELNERLSKLFGAVQTEVEIAEAKRVATFDELVDALAAIELDGKGEAPDAGEVRLILDRAGKSPDELKAGVAKTVRIHRLRDDIARYHELNEEHRAAMGKWEKAKAACESDMAKRQAELAEFHEEALALFAQRDRLSGAEGELRQLLRKDRQQTAVWHKKKQAADEFKQFMLRHGTKIPALQPKDPETLEATSRLSEVRKKIKKLETEENKGGFGLSGGVSHARRLGELCEERDKLEREVSRARNAWDLWQQAQRLQTRITELGDHDAKLVEAAGQQRSLKAPALSAAN